MLEKLVILALFNFKVYVRINKDGDADPSVHSRAMSFFKSLEEGNVIELKKVLLNEFNLTMDLLLVQTNGIKRESLHYCML